MSQPSSRLWDRAAVPIIMQWGLLTLCLGVFLIAPYLHPLFKAELMASNYPHYIQNPHSLCGREGCQYAKAIDVLGQAQRLVDNVKKPQERSKEMPVPAESLWCEYGPEEDQHPFSSRKPHVVMAISVYGDGGAISTDEADRTYCFKHAQAAGLVPKDPEPAGELVSGGDGE